MSITRRTFFKAGAAAVAITAVPHPLLVRLGSTSEAVPPIADPRLRALLGRALDAANVAGAAYADVRITHTWGRDIAMQSSTSRGVQDSESIAVGVRALVDGYWGFACSPVWSLNEMTRLGQEAVHQAKTNALGKPRLVALAPVSAVNDGDWIMPAKIDPFEVNPLEIADYLDSLAIFAQRTPNVLVTKNYCTVAKIEKAFASTVGSYCTQRMYRTNGVFNIVLDTERGRIAGELDGLSPVGMGWELYRDQPLRETIRRTIEALKEDLMMPVKPVDVGRYDVALDAASVTSLIHDTVGPATELDRALGDEANASGTSYLNQPFEMLGSYQAGGPSLTVVANRSESGGCATVQWDDEGVQPDEFVLVKDGVLTDFQTTRESAGWLADYYTKTGRALRSHGCASAPSAIYAPLQHAPNLAMAPGRETLGFDSLVAGITNGIAVSGLTLDMDFQHLNGLATGRFYEVKRGKRVARIASAGILFRAPELWKGLLTIGGQASARRYGVSAYKGEPQQLSFASVTAPPATFKQLTLIDPMRKA